MTDHTKLEMHREKARVTDKVMIAEMLRRCHVAVVALQDEPYPYAIPMNYGFEWEDQLVFYFHMAVEGHRIQLIRKNPKVMLSIYEWLDRQGYQQYRKETHDYRSVNVFGEAEIITAENEDEFIKGMSVLQTCNFRKPIRKITEKMRKRLFVLKVTADIVTAKAQYPISSIEEVAIPENIRNSPDGGEFEMNPKIKGPNQ